MASQRAAGRMQPLAAAAASRLGWNASAQAYAAAAVSSSALASSASGALLYARRGLHSSSLACASSGPRSGPSGRIPKGPASLPPRSRRHDQEWDKLRSHRDPLITTVDPGTKAPRLPPNDLELDQLSFRYGLPPLPTVADRVSAYSVEQSYYDRRDARIRDHLDRLLRMKTLSKKEMLILIDQIETSKWNLTEMQKAYVPETRHAEQDEIDAHRKTLQLGTGGIQHKADYRKKKEDKKAARAAGVPVKPPSTDGQPKYGYRRDLANIGPESWDYLSPYVILEPESRHLSYLDGAFKYEDRYVLWEEEHRNLALAAKLQRMKQLGIPLELANTLSTPTTITPDHIFPNSGIRRALKRLYASGGRPTDAWWKQFDVRPSRRNANERLLRRKEAKTMTEARRNIPDYIRRFEQENNAVEVNPGATTVLAQNLFLQSRIEQEKKKPSLLTKQQQQSAKNLMAVFAQRNRLAMKKMFLGTRNMWERLMLERTLERKYLEQYMTVGSDDINSKYLLQIESEMMEMMAEVSERFKEMDWQQASLQLRDFRLAQEAQGVNYAERYMHKMEELMEEHKEMPLQENTGESNWITDIIEWEEDPKNDADKVAAREKEIEEHKELDEELDSWNEWFEVQVAQELGAMIDCGEVKDEDEIHEGALRMAEKRVAKRLHASRQEWKEWKYRPQYADVENMDAVPDVTRVDENASTLGGEEKSPGQQIVAQILAKDPLIAASKRWKERMAPRFAAVDQYEGEALPGDIMQHVDASGNYVAPHMAVSGEGSPLVDSKFGPGSVLADYDKTLSTAGHAIMDVTNTAQRRAMVVHAMNTPLQADEYVRREAEDPMLELLHDHMRGGGAARRAAAQSGESDDTSTPHAFSTVDPKLGFEDDDFRLYDPVLTKGKEQKAGADEEDEPSAVVASGEHAKHLKKRGMDYLEDPDSDPMLWRRNQDRAYRRAHFLDLDPFGPANTDERRDFDDQYFHLDEEDYAYKRRVDPETEHQKPLTQLTYVEPYDEQPTVVKFDLSEQTQHVMYLLHKSDPVKYTPRALAHRFQLSAERTKSALLMQAIHYRMVENGVIHPLMMQYNEERAMDDLLHPTMPMIHDPPKFHRAQMPDYRWVREDDMHRVLAEEKAIEDRFLSRGERLDEAEREYYAKYGAIGTTPPEPLPPKDLDPRLMSPSKRSIMLIDVSEVPASRYSMALRTKEGTLREPNEDEYNYIRKQEKGPFPFTYIKYHIEDNPM